MDDIRTIGETATDLGLRRETVSDAAKVLGITYKPVPRCGKAKGLDANDRKRIAAMFKRAAVPA